MLKFSWKKKLVKSASIENGCCRETRSDLPVLLPSLYSPTLAQQTLFSQC